MMDGTNGRGQPRANRMPDGTPQHAVEAERELIGAALLCESGDVLKVALSGEDFWDKNLGIIWECIQRAAAQGNPGITVTASELEKIGELDRAADESYLAHLAGRALVEQVFPHTTLLTQPKIIREWAVRRAGLAEAAEAARRAFSGPLEAPLWERPEYRGTL